MRLNETDKWSVALMGLPVVESLVPVHTRCPRAACESPGASSLARLDNTRLWETAPCWAKSNGVLLRFNPTARTHNYTRSYITHTSCASLGHGRLTISERYVLRYVTSSRSGCIFFFVIVVCLFFFTLQPQAGTWSNVTLFVCFLSEKFSAAWSSACAPYSLKSTPWSVPLKE